MNQYFLPILFGALLLPAGAPGQIVEQFAPPRANCCLPATAKSLADQLQDWNQLGRYYADNQRLQQLPPDPGRVVFIGDSRRSGAPDTWMSRSRRTATSTTPKKPWTWPCASMPGRNTRW